MKKIVLFKRVLDVVYILHFIGLIGIAFILLFGTVNINMLDIKLGDWNLVYWLIFTVSLFAYLIFLRGLYYLREMARYLLSSKYFSENIIQSLKKSGNHFLYSGIISLTLFIAVSINKLTSGKLEFVYDTNLLFSLFLILMGIFFIIQSNALNLAKGINEENELTV